MSVLHLGSAGGFGLLGHLECLHSLGRHAWLLGEGWLQRQLGQLSGSCGNMIASRSVCVRATVAACQMNAITLSVMRCLQQCVSALVPASSLSRTRSQVLLK